MRESAVTSHIRLAAAKLNTPLWRNNRGAFRDDTGRLVKYGLGSEADLSSSDYIGIRPVLITPDMVGQVLGVFTAVEMKKEGFKFNKNDKHLLNQKIFIDIVKQYGGFAGFASSVEDFYRIIRYAENNKR